MVFKGIINSYNINGIADSNQFEIEDTVHKEGGEVFIYCVYNSTLESCTANVFTYRNYTRDVKVVASLSMDDREAIVEYLNLIPVCKLAEGYCFLRDGEKDCREYAERMFKAKGVEMQMVIMTKGKASEIIDAHTGITSMPWVLGTKFQRT